MEKGVLTVDGKEVKFLQIKDPTQLPWKDLGVDIVIESTGLFDSYEKSKVHLVAGAKRVVITAPAKDEDGADGKTVLVGVNEDRIWNVPDHVERIVHHEFCVAGHPDSVRESGHYEGDAFDGACVHSDPGHCGWSRPRRP